MAAPVKVLRLYANESGLSCFDTVEIEREMRDFAPPAPPLFVSKSVPASHFVVAQLPVGWKGERHPSPTRQILFCLRERSGLFPAWASPEPSAGATSG
jgi:hypothetical protein